MGKLFLSYVRADSEADAGRLADTLIRELPEADLFIDVRDIELGSNWKRIIARAIEDALVLLCAMGPQWELSPAVALELELAFKSNVSVVPILFRKASLVSLTEGLEPILGELRDSNALAIDHGTWQRDIASLLALLRKILSDPTRAQVIIDSPDPEQLLKFIPFTNHVTGLLNYAQDLAECLADEAVFSEAKEAAVHFIKEREAKQQYDLEMAKAGFAYRNIRGAEPKLVQIVETAKKRLAIEQEIRNVLKASYQRYRFKEVVKYLDDPVLLSKLTRLYQQYDTSCQAYKDGGMPYPHPAEAAKEFDEVYTTAIQKLRAEIPGITKRYPDRKWS